MRNLRYQCDKYGSLASPKVTVGTEGSSNYSQAEFEDQYSLNSSTSYTFQARSQKKFGKHLSGAPPRQSSYAPQLQRQKKTPASTKFRQGFESTEWKEAGVVSSMSSPLVSVETKTLSVRKRSMSLPGINELFGDEVQIVKRKRLAQQEQINVHAKYGESESPLQQQQIHLPTFKSVVTGDYKRLMSPWLQDILCSKQAQRREQMGKCMETSSGSPLSRPHPLPPLPLPPPPQHQQQCTRSPCVSIHPPSSSSPVYYNPAPGPAKDTEFMLSSPSIAASTTSSAIAVMPSAHDNTCDTSECADVRAKGMRRVRREEEMAKPMHLSTGYPLIPTLGQLKFNIGLDPRIDYNYDLIYQHYQFIKIHYCNKGLPIYAPDSSYGIKKRWQRLINVGIRLDSLIRSIMATSAAVTPSTGPGDVQANAGECSSTSSSSSSIAGSGIQYTPASVPRHAFDEAVQMLISEQIRADRDLGRYADILPKINRMAECFDKEGQDIMIPRILDNSAQRNSSQ
ncbi:hypothetical protein H4219_001860 [Mycoemilia scoparia]|uniref:Uncharacterized protein n=1 Tax=Mycoemilia scoparia TaxID=417184 RepID=A0A9W8DVI3_9FUNG|nr:hypothetical protein H4219_001860 [Mycoemilia scoparia]